VCRAKASFRVGLSLREKKNGFAVVIYTKLICCYSCRRRISKKDVVTKVGFRKMAAFAFAKHQIQAKWGRSRAAFDRL
jgi:hypothetical protein